MPSIEPIFDFRFTDHALIEMARREISQEQVRNVLANPEQTEMVREGRAVYQAKYAWANHQRPISCESLWILTVSHLM